MKYTKQEMLIVKEAMDQLIDAVLNNFAELRKNFESDDEFKVEMDKIAKQAGWDRKDFRKPFGIWSDKIKSLAGGLDENVLQNLFYMLGIPPKQFFEQNDTFFRKTIYSLILTKSMERNADLKTFVLATISGAKIVGRNFIRRGKLEKELLQTLEKYGALS